MNKTGNNTTGWARRLTALLITACLVMAMALPVYAEVDPLPGAPDEVELLEDKPETASEKDTIEQLPDANAPPEQEADAEQDAATPVPEQSAGPEQNATTETPEPTAEPALTPEPTATATATPVPTVTPTATPEPTEQPQKMYAARSVNNVQAVSEQEATEGFTVYFVVPNQMPKNDETVTVLDSDEIRLNVKTDENPGNSNNNEWWLQLSMEPTGRKTEDGHKIYAVKNCKDIKGDNFLEIQFQLYRNGGWTGQITLKEQEPKPISSYNNKMYDPTKGEWTDDSILTSHTYYKGKPIKFENRSAADLTSVKANFYIPDEKSGTLTLVNDGSDAKDVPQGKFVGFTIPDVECSYVQFTWIEDGKNKTSKYYNFYNESVSDNDKESFMYSETRNCFIYTGADNVRWGRENSFRIYYDATFSKMALNGDTDNFSIPKANNSETIYYRIKGGNGNSEKGTLVKDDTNENLYYVDIPQEYSSNSSIIFSGEEIGDDNATKGNGVSTEWLTIPTDDKNCFYADTNDAAVYNGATRDGYWAPKGTLRDAETWKNKNKNTDTKVVDIASAEFTEKPDTKYVTSTLYDYYTDYELNGNNRDSYDNDNAVNQRHWVTFRQFDQAISDYYQNYVDKNAGKSIIYPIYTGHFQPNDWEPKFANIASTLNLYGWSSYNIFIAANNSNFDIGNGTSKNKYAFQGIVADKRDSDGDIVMNGTTLKEPHFNEEFLTSQNSKNAKLGEVYHNVEFPFTQKEVFVEPEQNGEKKGKGVEYWWFDSSKTSLYLRKDTNSDQLYLGNDSTGETTAEYLSEASHNVDSASDPNKVSTQYGFFPFNETTTSKSAVRYNYGYGAKLEIPFTLTSTGTVKDDYNNEIPIRFYFSGDDDVWVFIDDQLVLDIGGAHAKVSGVLEFDQRDGKKDTVTSYVSRVKNNKTGNYGADNCDEGNPTTETRITYLNTTETYYKNASVSVPNLSTGKHTLTMYYMERGMWESNMAVAFNFPDNNELQVQKKVDLTNVTDQDFKDCFKKQKIFNFTIQNQATHYGEKEAVGSGTGGVQSQKVDLTAEGGNTFEPATKEREDEYIFRLDTNPHPDSAQDTKQVLHWYARYTDTQPVSNARKQRYGILTLNNPIDIKDMRFLTFQVYVDSKDGGELSLNNLYLELLDNQNLLDPPKSPGQKGSLGTTGINGATYGSVELVTDQWVTVKLDLHKMKEQGGFNNNVKTIRVGDNYNRNIYFRDFTFIPKAVPTEMTGFTTDQKEIPDYGSATTGQLKNAENAQYTSNMDTDTQLVDENGRFVLEDGEIVTFSDQFRRGSYISLKEDLNQNLYDTKWTVYENGQAVTSMSGGKSVKLSNPAPSLNGREGSGPDDGRTEVYVDGEVSNTGYTANSKKPDKNTIVFRSYKDPDENSSTLTKLKVEYVNTVKTGGLKIQKKAAEGETLTGTYEFKVTFNDVGGEGLEEKPIEKTVTINMSEGDTGTITGIPVGTRYTIEEVTPEDQSRLQSVTVPAGCNSAHVINNNTMVEGEIKEANTAPITAIFTNTKRTLINIEFDKLWKDADGNSNLSTANQPKEIYIQLQRRLAGSTSDADWQAVEYAGSEYVTVHHKDSGWTYTFSGLDQYPVNDTNTNYQYRIVEGTVDDKGNFAEVKPNETITIKGNTYVVTAEAKAEISEGDSTKVTQAKATDGTITGDSGTIVLTNTLQNPKFVLDIIKKDAEKDENDNDVPLSGVEFKLEKLKAETTEGEPQYTVDTNYKFSSNDNKNYLTGITGADGEITDVFKDLEPGTYRLTEIKAHKGYNLLAQPIVIEFTQGGKCYIDGQKVTDSTKFAQSGNTYTMHLTVLNRKTPELPHTGADAPSLWLLIGMPLAVAGLLIFTFRYNRKGGRRH